MPTIKDLYTCLESSRVRKGKTVLFRPNDGGYSFVELDYKTTRGALDEIVNKIPMVQAGIDEFTKSEKLLFQLFVSHCSYYIGGK